MRLSIIIPVYNERATIREVVTRVRQSFPGSFSLSAAMVPEPELVIVDDGSTDGTRDLLADLGGRKDTVVLFHERNRGKGAAVRTGLRHVSGDLILIQDADLEYDPADYPRLLAPILAGEARVVYGSRLLAGFPPGMSPLHRLGNRLLTRAANALYGSSLTDMETCYKVFTREIAGQLNLRAARWGFDPEITAQILRLGYTIHEVAVGYRGRTAAAGKKIGWRHGLSVLGTLIYCRFARDFGNAKRLA